MTNQEQFKKDTKELHDLLKDYKRHYNFMGGSRVLQSPLDLTIASLRNALAIVYTDEEERNQKQVDDRC